MSEMKLTYFNARGRAELTRLLFAQAGKKYVDCRLTGDEFKAMKDCKFHHFYKFRYASCCFLCLYTVNLQQKISSKH